MKKKTLFTTLLSLTIAISSFSQTLEITPTIGYTFGGKAYGKYGLLTVKGSESYGGALTVVMPTDVFVEFEYFRQSTVGQYRDYYDPSYNQNAKLNIDWYQIGFFRQTTTMNENIVPFAGMSLGATYFNLTENGIDHLSFSMALQGGVKIYLSDRIGLRLHARMLMPIQWGGFGFYAGSGGSGATVNAGTYFIQGDVGGGLIIRLGN